MLAATCNRCGRKYRVPDLERAYRCKSCGGRVAATSDEPEPEPELEPMQLDDSAPELDRDQRRVANRILRRATRIMRALRMFYWFSAVLAYAGVCFALINPTAFEREPLIHLARIVVAASMGTFFVVGALRIPFQPVLWASILAGLKVFQLVMQVIWFEPTEVQLALRLAWTAAFCGGAAALLPARALLREHPDLWGAQAMHGTVGQSTRGRRGKRASAGDARDAANRASRRAWIQSAALGGGAFAAAVLFSVALMLREGREVMARAQHRTHLEEKLVEFEAAWNSSDSTRVVRFFEDGGSNRLIRGLERIVERQGWKGDYPELERPDLDERGEGRMRVVYRVPNGRLELGWKLVEDVWYLSSVDPPPAR